MSYDPARVKSLFLNASELADPAERAAYLNRECGDDAALRARIEALLAADDSAGPGTSLGTADGSDLSTGKTRGAATRACVPETEPGSAIAGPDGPPPTVGANGDSTSPWSEMFETKPGPDVAEPDGDPSTAAVASDLPLGRTLDAVTPIARPARSLPGQVIGGRYTLGEVLGEGGMGTVFKAEQSSPVRRAVALKLVKVGMDSRTVLARFDAERQALAMMDHPSIARVFDGGATDANQPYFVMEYVKGTPITDYCDRHRLGVPARLNLFVAVCQAVQHAHQKGVIHRDLKPSNVLVTEVDGHPTPKVIDFGVAKATGSSLTDQTLGDTGAIVGTPAYMSPEQADPSSMDIDTRTDVYSLGVILYELLAGSPPIDPAQFRRGALLEMLRMVREVDPAKPSTRASTADALPNIAANRGIDPDQLKHALRGDLDWIVMKALEKDRSRRYETANGLGADLLRHLASEPVQAAPPSRSYRARKFVAKHRIGVAAAGLVMLALVAGVAGTTWGLVKARRSAEAERLAKLDAQGKMALAEANERRALAAAAAEKQAKETVEDVLGFVENKVFAAARPAGQEGGLGYDVKLADAIAAALPFIKGGFTGKPLTEARLRRTIGASFHYLGKPALAVAQYEAALALSRSNQGPDHPDTLLSMAYLAGSYFNSGRQADAIRLGEETLSLARLSLGPDHFATLVSMNDLALSYAAVGRGDESLRLREEVLPLQRAKLGPDHPHTLNSMGLLADFLNDLGRHAEAVKLSEEALALARARLGPDHPDTLMGMTQLSYCYAAAGRREEALRLCEEVVPLQRARLGPDHPLTLSSMGQLAISYSDSGRHAEAVKLSEETLALTRAKFGPDHPDRLAVMLQLAYCYTAAGRRDEALRLCEEVLPLARAKLGPYHPHTLGSMGQLAYCYAAAGRDAEALRLREEVLPLQKAKLGPDHPRTLNSMGQLAYCYAAAGRREEALRLREETLALRRARLGPDHPDTLSSMGQLASSYAEAGRHAEAIKLREEALALTRARLGPDHPHTLYLVSQLAFRYADLGRQAEAMKLREEALANRRAKLGPDHPDALNSMDDLALSYADLGRQDEAFKLREEALAIRRARLGPNHPDTLYRTSQLVNYYQAAGRQDEAVRLLKEALALTMTRLGPDHPDTLGRMGDLALGYAAAGRNAEALKLREETLALRRAKLGPSHPHTLWSVNDLADAYLKNGREREAWPLLSEYSTAKPKDTNLSAKVAALQAWCGLDEEFAATRRRVLAAAAGTEVASTADRAAKAGSLLPSADGPELDAAINLGRRAVELGKNDQYLDLYLMSLAMAQYRKGQFAEALSSLDAAKESPRDRPGYNLERNKVYAGTSAFYRAMCLFRLGRADEARALATDAASKVKPPPADGQYPLVDGADHDDLILWLAYREAKALIRFDPPPAVPAKP